jgi:hypothetical protein
MEILTIPEENYISLIDLILITQNILSIQSPFSNAPAVALEIHPED